MATENNAINTYENFNIEPINANVDEIIRLQRHHDLITCIFKYLLRLCLYTIIIEVIIVLCMGTYMYAFDSPYRTTTQIVISLSYIVIMIYIGVTCCRCVP